MSFPLISIIIPCYNQGEFLGEAIESVIAQSYSNWECIIVNDGSSDNTEEIAKSYCQKEDRIVYYSKTNGGLSSARNAGIAIAHGELIQFLDSDDILVPEKFDVQINAFNSDSNLDICYTKFSYFDNSGELHISPYKRMNIKNDPLEDFILNWGFEFVIPIHAPLFKSSLFKEDNLKFNEGVIAREDWLLWIDLAKLRPKYKFIDQKLALYRKHDSSMVHDPVFMLKNTFTACMLVFEKTPEPLKEKFISNYSDYFSSALAIKIKQYDNLNNKLVMRLIRKIKKLY